jgi:beta-1,4-mannosyltransferase
VTERRLLAFPAWTDNPYIGILYLASIARGVRYSGIKELDVLLEQIAGAGDGDVFHMHWTGPVSQDAPDEAAARERMRGFVAAVDSFRARGGAVLWTVHNRLPHETAFRDVELELCRYLAATADAVHVMAPTTVEVVSEDYRLDPARVVQVPMPSYQGLYAVRDGDRERARARLGVPEGRRAILFFGRMRAYKGLDQLFDALRLMVDRGEEPPVLLLAGPTPDGVEDVITATLPAGVQTIREHGYIPDEDLVPWFAAADLAVFPFRAVLNSGSVNLAATLGLPVLVPGEPHVRATYADQSWVRWFDPADPVPAIAAALGADSTYDRPVDDIRLFSEQCSPWTVSCQMADVIDAL